MQEINEDNIDELVKTSNDPDTLKELILYAVAQDREDLIESILEKTIQSSHLIEKLQDYELTPNSISFLGEDEDETEALETHEPVEKTDRGEEDEHGDEESKN